jgi:hypothetical protein
MMASRGMGAIRQSKVPKGVKKPRLDDTDFTQYAGGGLTVRNPSGPGNPSRVKNPGGAKNPGNPAGKYSAMPKGDLDALHSQAQNTGDTATVRGVESEQDIRKRLNAQYAEGGKVNAAGNYTKPEMRKRIVSQVKAAATQGTGAGQWSARKAQLVAKKYKAAGGGYRD